MAIEKSDKISAHCRLLAAFTLVFLCVGLESMFAEPLYIVANIGNPVDEGEEMVTPKRLKSNLERAFRDDDQIDCKKQSIEVEPISRFHYNFLTTKLGQNPTQISGRTMIEPDQTSPNRWRLFFGDQDLDLESLDVTGKQNGKNATLSFKKSTAPNAKGPGLIGGIGETQFDVYARFPGVYSVKLPEGFLPEKYTAIVRDINETDLNAKPENIEAKWPQLGEHCLITIPDFKGETSRLKKTLGDPQYCPQPINITDVQQSIRFYHANVGDIKPGNAIAVVNNSIMIRFNKPENREPKRVWIKFPLTLEEAENVVADLEKLGADDIPKKIRASNPELATLFLPGKEFPQYDLNLSAKWYEMPEIHPGSEEYYKAVWKGDKAANWNNMGNRNWLVRVFEFQSLKNPNDVVALRTIHPVHRKQTNAVELKINNWGNLLNNLNNLKANK